MELKAREALMEQVAASHWPPVTENEGCPAERKGWAARSDLILGV